MACISPPEPADRDLLAYIDGESDHQVTAHLERCPHCRERTEHLARRQGVLVARLYRLNCPPPITLGEYHLGMLAGDEAETISRHLAECPRCGDEVSQLKDYLANLAPDMEVSLLERAKERVRILFARLANGGLKSSLLEPAILTPAYAGVRGSEGEPLIFEADNIQVVIEILEEADQPDRKTILGLVIGLDSPDQLKAHLWQANRRIDTVPVEELGNFVFPPVAPAHYELILSGPEVEIHIQDLRIGTN